MEKIILIKYGELTTKKDNRGLFTRVLYNNLSDKLKDYNCEIIKEYSRMFIKCSDNNLEKVIEVLKNTFGILEFNIAYQVHTNIEDIKSSVIDLLNNESFNTFKVITKRSDKSFPHDSIEFNHIIGGHILKNIPCKATDWRHVWEPSTRSGSSSTNGND